MTVYRNVACPLCGTSHGKRVTRRMEGRPDIQLERENFWQGVQDFDPEKPLGVIQETTGRGSFRTIGHFGPEDDPDGYFPFIKARILNIVKEWVVKGWITVAEAHDAARGVTFTAADLRPTKQKTKAEAGEITEEKLSALKDILDEDKKAASIKKLENEMGKLSLDEEAVTGYDDVEQAIDDYREAEREDKESAWDDLVTAVDAMEIGGG
jgi:hypothetical protein